MTNRQWLFKEFVAAEEFPQPKHFELVSSPMPVIKSGEILVRVLVLGTSPAQRMYVSSERNFHIVVEKGEVMKARGIAEVVESQNSDYEVGEIIEASLSWQDYVVLNQAQLAGEGKHNVSIRKAGKPVSPLTTSLGLFGQLGCSAYVSMHEIGKVQAGDTVLVSAAAGGVGSIACQLARVLGAKKVVGIAGGPEKCQWLLDRNLCDAVIDYKEGSLPEAMKREMPDGLNVYLDSVGGDMLDAALQNLAMGARVVMCGMISTEYQRPRPPGPRHIFNLLYRSSSMEGFFVFNYIDRWPEFISELQQWYGEGKLQLTEHVFEGLESAPEALGSLFTGGNTGGCQIRVADDPAHLPKLESH